MLMCVWIAAYLLVVDRGVQHHIAPNRRSTPTKGATEILSNRI